MKQHLTLPYSNESKWNDCTNEPTHPNPVATTNVGFTSSPWKKLWVLFFRQSPRLSWLWKATTNRGAEIFWELFVDFGNYVFQYFFHGFNWRWKRFRWGWAGPAKRVGLKKKTVEGVWGRARSLPPKFGRPCVRNFLSIPRKIFLCPSIHMFLCLVFIRVLGP